MQTTPSTAHFGDCGRSSYPSNAASSRRGETATQQHSEQTGRGARPLEVVSQLPSRRTARATLLRSRLKVLTLVAMRLGPSLALPVLDPLQVAFRVATLLVATVLVVQPQPVCAAPPREATLDDEIDLAIGRALQFLAKEQAASGAWKVDAYGESTAATSLAIMAFMSAGHVPGEGPYADAIDRGIRYVLAHQEPNGMLVHHKSHGPFYCHGISTLMLAEVVGMLKEPLATDARHALEKAVALTLRAQAVEKSRQNAGGWRYQTTSLDSDLSVTGWQLLALRAAKNVGCDVPAQAIDSAVAYVKLCSSSEDGGFAYQPGGPTTPTRTGTGILALEVCGDHGSDEAKRGAKYLLDRPLDLEERYFYYGAYYCSVGLFKLGGPGWPAARNQITGLLLELQQADGSWLAPHGSEHSAGKVYCTTMSVLALAVEYQYLPIYQR